MSIERIGAQIKIDVDLCTGCGICVNTCPLDVIRLSEESKKAAVKYPEDCMLCDYCEQECPEKAIYVAPVKMAPTILSWG